MYYDNQNPYGNRQAQIPGFPGFPGMPGFPGGGAPQGPPWGSQPGMPPGMPPGGGPPVGPPPGGGQPPMGPPPSFAPQMAPSSWDQGSQGIRRCLYRYTYIWLNNGNAFWFYPIFVVGNSMGGYRWRGNRWEYRIMNLNRIRTFQCY